MFERFTDRARRVLVLAQEEARELGHNYIGTEHVLLGLSSEATGVAGKTLETFGLTTAAIRAKVVETLGPMPDDVTAVVTGSPPFTPRAKKVLELSLREAVQLGHNYIGTEHILLGMVREGEGVAAVVLQDLGAPQADVRQRVIETLAVYTPPAGPPPADAASRAMWVARRLAGGKPPFSYHVLLGLSESIGERQSIAAKVLEALGVTKEKVEAEVAKIDISTTSEAPAPPPPVRVDIVEGVTIEVASDQEGKLRGRLEEVADAIKRALEPPDEDEPEG